MTWVSKFAGGFTQTSSASGKANYDLTLFTVQKRKKVLPEQAIGDSRSMVGVIVFAIK
jgi:hypothetical protein